MKSVVYTAARTRRPIRHWVGLLLLLAAFMWSFKSPVVSYDRNAPNLYVLQAEAFLKGRLDITLHSHDLAVFNGRAFVPFPPAPALILTPIVALFGIARAHPVLFALLLTASNVVVLRRILSRLGVDASLHVWLLAAFFLGTSYWMAVEASWGVWLFAHIVAVTFLLLAIAESLGRGRGWLTGALLGGAFLSRQLTLFAAIFLIAALWRNARFSEPRQRLQNLLGFSLSVAGALAIYLSFNYLRFGSPFDTGYEYLALTDFLHLRVEQYGLFSPAYIPFNLIYLFLQGFHLAFYSLDVLSGVELDNFGTSLLGASPFLIVAFYSNRKDRLVQTAWLTIGVIMLGHLLYYNNGWIQIHVQRFTLDYWPILILLVALGMQRQREIAQERLWQWMIGYAIVLNLFAFVLLPYVNSFLEWWYAHFQ
jgi:hypothetical protein